MSARLAGEHSLNDAPKAQDGERAEQRARLERKQRAMDPTVIHTEGCPVALFASAAVAGLSLCNQHTALFYAAPLSLAEAAWWLYWAFVETRKSTSALRWTILRYLGGAILTGAAFFAVPHVYLVVTARGTEGVRGSWGDTGSLQGLISHVLRREYGTFALSPMKHT